MVRAIEAQARAAQSDIVERFSVSTAIPTLDYNSFVTSDEYLGGVAVAAQAAAASAVAERQNNGLFTRASVEGAARVGATTALRSVLASAARAARTELPLTGTFGPGQGDPRLTVDIQPGDTVLSPVGALAGTIFLPASHPTNPFRHRRHPDHTVGLDILRHLRLDFDGTPTNTLQSAGFGVERITGIYREEISGLHKPLGPDPDTAPIGLKVEGKFELNRISLIDSLNAL